MRLMLALGFVIALSLTSTPTADAQGASVIWVIWVNEPKPGQLPDTYPNNHLGPDEQNYINNDAFLLLMKNINQIKGKLRIQMWCGTKDKTHIVTVRDYH
jgi:hypothetical protein